MFVNLSLILLLFGSRYRLPPKPPHIHPGKQCPKVVAYDDPELLKIAVGGMWYVNQITATSHDAQQYRCITAEFIQNDNNSSNITVNLHGVTYNNRTESSDFSISPDRDGEPGKFEFNPNLPYNELTATGIINHKMIEKNPYILMYACFLLHENRKFCDGAIIFSRQPRLWLRELEELRHDLTHRQEKPVYLRHIVSNVHCEQLNRTVPSEKTMLASRKQRDDFNEEEEEQEPKRTSYRLPKRRATHAPKCDCAACLNATKVGKEQYSRKRTNVQRQNTTQSAPSAMSRGLRLTNAAPKSEVRKPDDKYPSARTRSKLQGNSRSGVTAQPRFVNPADMKEYFRKTMQTAQNKINKLNYISKTVTPIPSASRDIRERVNTALAKNSPRDKARRRQVSTSVIRVPSTPPPVDSAEHSEMESAELGSKPRSSSDSPKLLKPSAESKLIKSQGSIHVKDDKNEDSHSDEVTDLKIKGKSARKEMPSSKGSKDDSPPKPNSDNYNSSQIGRRMRFPRPLSTLQVVKTKNVFGENVISTTFKDTEPFLSTGGFRVTSHKTSPQRPLATLEVVKTKDPFGKQLISTTFKHEYEPIQHLPDGKPVIVQNSPGNAIIDFDIERPVIVKINGNVEKNMPSFNRYGSQTKSKGRPGSQRWSAFEEVDAEHQRFKNPDLTKNMNVKVNEDVDMNVLWPQKVQQADRFGTRNRYPVKATPNSKKKGSLNSLPHTPSNKKQLPLDPYIPLKDEDGWNERPDSKLGPLGKFPYVHPKDDGWKNRKAKNIVSAKMTYQPLNG